MNLAFVPNSIYRFQIINYNKRLKKLSIIISQTVFFKHNEMSGFYSTSSQPIHYSSYLPDVEVKADLVGSSSGPSLSIAHRLDESCSWNKCFHSGRRIYVSGCCGNAAPIKQIR